MQVATILKAKGGQVTTIRPHVTLATAVHRMKLDNIGALVVSEDGARISGILSERDIVHALATHGAETLALRVSDLMTRTVETCKPQDSIKQIMTVMTRRRIRHLPVTDGGRLVGIISIGDVVKNRMDEMELETNVLRDAYIAAH